MAIGPISVYCSTVVTVGQKISLLLEGKLHPRLCQTLILLQQGWLLLAITEQKKTERNWVFGDMIEMLNQSTMKLTFLWRLLVLRANKV